MVAKISLGKSLFGALAYNGEKIDKEQGKLLGTNKIFDGCSGRMDISRAMQDFSRYLSPHVRTEKPVMHVSLNPHPDDRLTDMELENIAREYMERMGFGEQPYIIYKHEDIDRHHLHRSRPAHHRTGGRPRDSAPSPQTWRCPRPAAYRTRRAERP